MGYEEFSYQYDAMSSVLATVGGFFLVLLLALCFVIMGMCVAVYVLESLGLYTISKRRGIHNPWLSWLPIGNMWILGSLSDQYQYVAKGKIRNRRKILLGLGIASAATSTLMYVISFVMGLFSGFDTDVAGAVLGASFAGMILIEIGFAALSITQAVFMYIALYDLYQSFDPNNGAMYLVLSIFFTITIPFFVFFNRKKDLGMPPRKQPEPVQPVIMEAPAAEVVTVVADAPVVEETPVAEKEACVVEEAPVVEEETPTTEETPEQPE